MRVYTYVEIPRCDVCRRRAVQFQRDVKQIASDGAWAVFVPQGAIRYGCIIHPPAPSRIYYLKDADCPESILE